MLLSARSLDRSPLARADQEPVSDRAREKKGHENSSRSHRETRDCQFSFLFRSLPALSASRLPAAYLHVCRASQPTGVFERLGEAGGKTNSAVETWSQWRCRNEQLHPTTGEKEKKSRSLKGKRPLIWKGGTLGNRRPGMNEGGGDRRQRPPTLGHRDPERRVRTPEDTPPPRSTGAAHTNAVQGDAHRPPNRRRSLLLPCFSASSHSSSRRRPVGP